MKCFTWETEEDVAKMVEMNGDIPKIIHQTWKNTIVPDKWLPHFHSWNEFCKRYGYQHRLWTDADNLKLIQDDFAWFLPFYNAFKYPIQRVDAVRPFILFKYGGVYSDLDM